MTLCKKCGYLHMEKAIYGFYCKRCGHMESSVAMPILTDNDTILLSFKSKESK